MQKGKFRQLKATGNNSSIIGKCKNILWASQITKSVATTIKIRFKTSRMNIKESFV